MATNNYYGFTHAGTQYGTEYTAANQYSTANQFVTPAAGQTSTAGFTGTPTQPYTISGYTRPANQPAGPGGTDQQYSTSAYMQNQQGFPPNVVGAVGTRPPLPPPASTAYPTPSYSATTPGTAATYSGFPQPSAPVAKPVSTAPSFTNYDAAVYNAVSAYAQGAGGVSRGGGGGGFSKRGGGQMNRKGPRLPPKAQTLHYCDVCKISCAGPQTYKEHLDGQKHKKKEALLKAGAPPTVPKGSPAGLRCELCDVTCTGNDAYAAHLRGAKHQKVLKLHQKLGKPIPAENPTVIPPATNSNATVTTPKKIIAKPFVKPATPSKINFVSGKSEFDRFLHTDPLAPRSDTSTEQLSTSYPPSVVGGESVASEMMSSVEEDANKSIGQEYVEKDIEPVGQAYIEEIRTDDGKALTFNCKLCDCKFNDPNAKEMHMKGRRHRLQYKKKVDPKLIVDIKPSNRQKKLDERRALSRRGLHEGYARMPPPMAPLLPTGPRSRFSMLPQNMYPQPPPSPLYFIPPLVRRGHSRDDRHVMVKHADIYPKDDELQAIQKIVSSTEKSLKFVSDEIAEADARKEAPIPIKLEAPILIKTENGVNPSEETTEETEPEPPVLPPISEVELQAHRVLKGVMRVGNLAKGLLLRGDSIVELVVLCSVKPTVTLLDKVLESLPKKLQIVAPEDQYSITRHLEESGLCVKSITGPQIEVKVTFTSPLVRAAVVGGEATATTVTDPDDLLDKEKCLDALAALRHAKWFQARATALNNCVIVIRILRDICNRVPAWKCLSAWVVELLAEKSINSSGVTSSAAESLRNVFEVISGGILLTPHGSGIMDPCEKDVTDALGSLSRQDRIDVTQYAQYALRLITFKKIHEVLGMPELPKFEGGRKRPRDNVEEVEEEVTQDGKKDKKDTENE